VVQQLSEIFLNTQLYNTRYLSNRQFCAENSCLIYTDYTTDEILKRQKAIKFHNNT